MSYYKKLRYKIDKSLSRSIWSVISLLFLLVIVIVLFISSIDYFFISHNKASFQNTFLDYVIAAIKGNTVENSTFVNIFINTAMIGTSLFVTSVVIGLIVNNLRERIENIRNGRSFVLESNHQIVLGWSQGIHLIIREFLLANENSKNTKLVILDEMNPVQMNEKLLKMFPERKDYERIIPKQGSTFDRDNLQTININESRSILINHLDDMNTIKTMAAIINNPNRRSEPYNISTKINSRKNYELARIIGGEESTVLYFGDMLSRIDAQTCLQSGLANVFLELVNFDGDEIYFTHESSLENRTFREAVLSYDTSSIIGIERASEIILSPSFDEIIQAGDKIISISEDDDKVLKDGINLPDSGLYNEKNIIKGINKDDKVERVFVLGSSEDDLSKIRVLSKNLMKYLDSGSEIFLVNDRSDTKELLEEIENKNHLVFDHILGDVRSRDFLNTLDLRNGDKILILSPFNGLNEIESCDADVLFTLINLRDIQVKTGKNFSLTTELINSKNAELFQSERDDDYLYSEVIVQSMLVQIAENPSLGDFFNYLVSPQGAEIYFRPISDYVDISEPIDFYSVCESAGLKGETAIGYQRTSNQELKSLNAGVNINPLKSKKRTFSNNDKVIVFAEN